MAWDSDRTDSHARRVRVEVRLKVERRLFGFAGKPGGCAPNAPPTTVRSPRFSVAVVVQKVEKPFYTNVQGQLEADKEVASLNEEEAEYCLRISRGRMG